MTKAITPGPVGPAQPVTRNGRLTPADWAVVGGLAALATALRFYNLGSPLWFDEIVTVVDSVRNPLSTIVTHFPGNNDHPLYSVLARVSVVAFGESPWSLRLPAVLFGVLSVPLLYLLGVAVTDRREALAASLLLTVSYHHVWFSQNARAYTILLCCALLGTHALIRWLDTGRRSFLGLYAVVTAVGAYAHLTMVLASIGQALALAVDWTVHRRSSRLHAEWKAAAAGFAGAAVLTVLAYAPMLADVSAFFTTQTATATEVATPGWALLATLRGLEIGFGLRWGILAGLVIAAAGTLSYLRERSVVAWLFLFPLPATIALALLFNRPVFPRFAFFVAGFGLLIVMRGAAVLAEWIARQARLPLSPDRARTLAVAAVTVLGVVVSLRSLPYGYRHPKQDYEAAVRAVDELATPGDRIVVVGDPASIPINRYLHRPWPRIDTADDLREIQQDAGRVWVVYTFPSYIRNGQPELWSILTNECQEAAEIDGNVAGGAITVTRCP